MNKYEKLKQVIMEADLEKDWRGALSRWSWLAGMPIKAQLPIRLADVLLAIGKARKHIFISQYGMLFKGGQPGIEPTHIEWNLRDDNLDHQSEECKQFLIELLTSQ